MTTWLFNPFIYIAGLRSLVIGWVLMLLTAFIAYFSYTHFDGALDVHIWFHAVPAWYHLAEQLIAWGCLVLAFFLAGRFFSPSAIRFIDVAGTMALARIPMLFIAILNISFSKQRTIIPEAHPTTIGMAVIAMAFVMIAFLVWMIALMYNAFKVSCNMKGNKAVGVFIASIVVAEVISKIIFYFLYLPLK